MVPVMVEKINDFVFRVMLFYTQMYLFFLENRTKTSTYMQKMRLNNKKTAFNVKLNCFRNSVWNQKLYMILKSGDNQMHHALI